MGSHRSNGTAMGETRRGVLPVVAVAVAVLFVPVGRGVAAAEADACADAEPAPAVDRDRVATVHRPAVDCLWSLGVLTGVPGPDGQARIRPRATITRGQFAALVHRLLDDHLAAELPAPRRPRFADVPAGHVFDEPVHRLAAAGVVAGVGGQRFEPTRGVRRDEAASLVMRAVALAAGRTLAPSAGPYFADVRANPHRDAIDAGFEHRLVDGVRHPCGDGDGRFAPARSAERQQGATLLVRMLAGVDRIAAGDDGDRRADPTCPAPVWEPDLTAARRFADMRAGSVAIAAIGTDGRLVGDRAATSVPAASLMKVMFLTAYLRQPAVRDRALGDRDRDLLEPMIRWSANAEASRIADQVGPDVMTALADRAGMRDFVYTRPWGASRTSARDQARFVLDLPRHLPARHRTYALDLLTRVVDGQRWGIGQVDTPGWTAHFKGGWGSGSGAVNHQVVLLRHRETDAAVALAVTTTSSPSHDYGSVTLEGVFRRLLADLP